MYTCTRVLCGYITWRENLGSDINLKADLYILRIRRIDILFIWVSFCVYNTTAKGVVTYYNMHIRLYTYISGAVYIHLDRSFSFNKLLQYFWYDSINVILLSWASYFVVFIVGDDSKNGIVTILNLAELYKSFVFFLRIGN